MSLIPAIRNRVAPPHCDRGAGRCDPLPRSVRLWVGGFAQEGVQTVAGLVVPAADGVGTRDHVHDGAVLADAVAAVVGFVGGPVDIGAVLGRAAGVPDPERGPARAPVPGAL